jgi:phenylpropionate dioxygenase-like ring-hydroxylating dioxygenase large terminal subunit
MTEPLEHVLAAFDENAPLARAFTLPGSFYTDPRIFALEARAVFGRTWQMIGRAAQVERPGQFIAAEVGGERVVVVRGDDGVLRAFFNVCRHHAAAVVTSPEGCAERLKCPYHGWTYGLDGALRTTPEFDGVEGFDRAANGLVPLKVDTWEKFVFVNLDPGATPLRAYLGRLADDVLPLRFDTLQFVERREYVLRCNWKVFVDNYLDGGYHVPYLHKGLNAILSFKEYTIETADRFCLQSSPAAGDALRRGTAKYYWLYPNLMLNWYEGYLDTNLVVPLDLDRMKVVFEFYFAGGPEGDERKSIDVSERIQDEDHAICESVQKGLASRAYGAGRLSVRREAGERLFHQLLAKDLRSGNR